MANDSDDESMIIADEEDEPMTNSQIDEIFNAAVTLEQKELEETKLKQVIGYHYKNKKKLEVLGHTNSWFCAKRSAQKESLLNFP